MTNKAKSSNFYDNLRKSQWGCVATFGPSAQTRYDVVARLIKQHKAKPPILDVGCGIGIMLKKLRHSFTDKKLFGSDFSNEAVKLAKMNNPGLSFFQLDLLKKIDERNKNKFKTIICSEVLEHVSNVSKAVETMSKLIKVSGLVFITVPYQKKYWTQHDDFSGHVQRFEKDQLENIFKDEGFSIVESFSHGWLLYDIYYKFILNSSPKKIMPTNDTPYIHTLPKRMISYLLFHAFKTEYYLRDKKRNRGRRLFIVARKDQADEK